jgi:ABC-type Na+ efflux pump permease subunit
MGLADILNFAISYIIFTLTVFAISSGLLYSEGPRTIRDWWLRKFKGKKIEHLFICQLCQSFWIAMALHSFFLPFRFIIHYILVCFSVAGCSWLLGGATLFFLNGKYAFEQYAKYRQMEFKRRQDDLR